jgi:Phage integrase, N-terminal SAM-like domain
MSSSISVSGHIRLRTGKRGGVWYAKWRDATGQHERRLGKDWSASGQPAPGFLREKDAQTELDAILVDARRGAAAQGRTGVTFRDVAEGWYASGKLKRDWSLSTQRDYRSVLDHHLIETFGALRIESVSSARIERWRDGQVQDATSPTWTAPGCASCASTTCATPSGRWRSTRPRSSRSRRGWATPTSRPRCATCTTRAARTMHACCRAPSGPRPRRSTRLRERPCARGRATAAPARMGDSCGCSSAG